MVFVAATKQDENDKLQAELDEARNEHLASIARNTERPLSRAESNAVLLRKYLGELAVISEGTGTWGAAAQVAEVNDDNVVTLFTPRTYPITSTAWSTTIRCEELAVYEIPQGACKIRINVFKRYGQVVQLGEITKWEDRWQGASADNFKKGTLACQASFSKGGSPGIRTINIYSSQDGANLFRLESTTGERFTADNGEISKRFLVMQVDYLAAGYLKKGFRQGESQHRLFV
jgi:hypothetical protein